ncbi:ergothioneine biosynthesis protein EgtB [Eudoraea chungangensis]|uniref:ergothioneine biosynthesis protein EgtB n=1 Tax=Eudoraea chungangensis TaxID=1481905 RepID=UPI0023ED3E4F|nr:ergothioneine biosynthesis protein EgtB [Eudoraea chungangensis]
MLLTKTILDTFLDTRLESEKRCAPLQTEDYVVQPIEDVSPPKWHLGHTTWFFEEFLLQKYSADYIPFNDDFSFVFNSYYESVGKRVIRANRGNLSRPSVAEVYDYRKYVTDKIVDLFSAKTSKEMFELLEIGIHHEKQHQELLLTDIKYILGNNPLFPFYKEDWNEDPNSDNSEIWLSVAEGIYSIGHTGEGFCFDNELGNHQIYLPSYEISNLLVTNADFLEFIQEGGYSSFEYWHAEGWDWLNKNQISAPLYWHNIDGTWHQYTLKGLQLLDPNNPVSHISYYEAFAYAQWRGLRLPTEFEWEVAQENFKWGDRWEWTESAYLPYPGYKKADGALGEYNGKFMVNQKVLRGGSVATPKEHTRATYRNFFHPKLRWQYTGLRLAR